MPTRILYVIPALGNGGAQRQLAGLIDGLDRARYEPVVCLIYSERVIPRSIAPHDCRLIVLGKDFRRGAFLPPLLRLCRCIRAEQPSIIHSWLNEANAYSRMAALLTGHCGVITSVRSRVKGFWRTRDRFLERVLWRLSQVVIVNSAQSKSELVEELGLPANRIQVVPNGVDTRYFGPGRDKAASRATLSLPSSGFVLAMVARYSPEKGYDTLIDAVKLLAARRPLPHLRILCVGETTSPEIEGKVRARVHESQLDRIFDFRGAWSDMRVVYAAADALILPSRYEGFANVVIEALASGRPAIVSEAANPATLVRAPEIGWVFPTGDAGALAECLEQAVAAPAAVLDDMGRRGRQAVVEAYSAESMIRNTVSIYTQVLGRVKTLR